MGLIPNTRLGAYEIVALIGAGGMGEVYRARDTRLDRGVALKVITGGGTSDTELRTRFEREARAISSLNHPNICVLHDIGREQAVRPTSGTSASGMPSAEDTPFDFLVMEYLEGETLADRLARGRDRSNARATPPMTVDEAVAIAIQIAGALDGAHREGIVHRDLKPANIMLTKAARAGSPASIVQVKLMDLGLARLIEESGSRSHGTLTLAQLSTPTMTSPLTREGTILGTLHYMSPEQLEGKHVDGRTDIFAFGIVLYEMLAGRRPFEGKSQASVIGAILEQDPPPITSLQPLTPPLLAELVARCLAKDPDGRWQSVRDLMRQLEWIAARTDAASTAAIQSQADPPRTRFSVLRMSAALLATAVIVGGAVAWMLRPAPPQPPSVSRFTFVLPDGHTFSGTGRHVMTLSPDGTKLVYVANEQLYLRNMHELTSAPIPGSEGSNPMEPVFSPNGQWVAFFSRGSLKKIPVTGGTAVLLSPAQNPLGATWEDGRILLGQPTPPAIVEIPENGGAAKPLVTLSEKTEQAARPQLIAGGRSVLFTLRTSGGEWDDASIVVHHLATGKRTVLVKGSDARVLPTGHLVFAREGTIFAVPFDETGSTVTGGPVPIQQGIQSTRTTGTAHVAWSVSGTFAIAQGPLRSFLSSFYWVSRGGQEERTKLPARNYGILSSEVRASPNATRVAVTVYSDDVLNLSGGASAEVWVGDIARGTLDRLSTSGQSTSPVWTPDGERVCYDSGGEVFCQAADGSSAAQALFKVDGLRNTRPFSPDQTRMVLETSGSTTGDDISIATIGPPVETRPLLNTTSSESAPAISPDGRWLAYQSDESGRAEVYVRPFPSVQQGRSTISSGGGTEPRWAPNGRELFFTVRNGGWTTPGILMSVPVQPGSTFIAGQPTVVLKIPAGASEAYDVAPDGRFLFHFQRSMRAGEEAPRQEIIIVQNWFEELKARVPTRVAK
jgi:serine/threonine-protein kinase